MSTEIQDSQPAKRNHWLGITKKEWACFKVLFFFQFAAMGSFYPFCVVYYIARQLTPSQIGILECTLPFVGAFTKPIVAQIADRFNLHKICLGLSIAVYTLSTVGLIFVRPPSDPVFPSYPVNVTCEHNGQHSFSVVSCDYRSPLSNITSLSNDTSLHFSSITKTRHSAFYRKCDKPGDSCQITCSGRLDSMFTGGNIEKVGFRATLTSSMNFAWLDSNETVEQCSLFHGKLVDDSVVSQCHAETFGRPLENCKLDCYCSSKRSEYDPQSNYIDSYHSLSESAIFGIILAIRLIAAASYSPIFSLEDSIVYTTLGPENRPYWGQQKMFGQLAFGIMALIIGLLMDKWTFDAAFIANGVLNFGAILVVFLWIPQPKDVATKKKQNALKGEAPSPSDETHGQAMKRICSSPMFIIAIFIAFFSGIFIGIIFVITPQWQLFLGGQGSLIGGTAIAGCFLQAIGFAFSGLVVRKFGEVVVFLGVFFSFAVRYIAYSFLTPGTVWISIPLEITQIFCFSFYLAAMTNYADTIAPKGMSATIQAILATSYFGLGTGVGILTSNICFEKLGGKFTFQIYGLAAAACFVVLLVIYLTFLRKRLYPATKKRSDDQEKDKETQLQAIEAFLDKSEDEI